MELFRRLSFAMVLLTLAGCGGGDGGLSTEGEIPTPDSGNDYTISLSLSSDTVSEQTPITITATVMNGSAPVSGKLVSFEVDDSDLANLEPENGAATTNSDGVVEIQLLAGSKSGGGVITASIDDGETSAEIAFNSTGGGGSVDPQISEITLFANSQQLASSGAQEVLLTAIAKNSDNNLISGVDISFISDSGDILVTTSEEGVKSSTTNENGVATASLRTQGNPENRAILVTALNGSVSDEVNVYVVGTEVQLSGSSSLALDDQNTFILNVLNSDSEGIADVEVALSLANTPADGVANLSFPATVTTSPEGQAVVTVIGETGGTNAIVATALGASVAKSVTVQADSFQFTSFNNGNGSNVNPSEGASAADVLLSDTATVTLTWNRSGEPVADGTTVEFSTTRGTLAAGSGVVTGGEVSATLTSSDAGKAIVTFTGTDGDITLTNQLEFEFVAETVDRLVAQASPSSIGPNEQTSTISVVARDPNGNLVKNKTIVFSLSDTTGGSIFPAEAVTDSDGSASTVYTSNTVSAQNEVVITATVKDQPTVSDSVELTVADRELFIALGTGNEIEDNETTYTKRFVAFVTDADSNPVVNQKLTISAVPEGYYKGQWVPLYDGDEFIVWDTRGVDPNNQPHYCTNEDTNRDGILDPGEDTNNNGALTPGNVIAALLTLSTEGDAVATTEAFTDNEGKVLIDLVYAQSYGSWVDINLIVSGKVSGTESSVMTTYTLPNSAEDVNNEDISPPTAAIGMNGPFGLLPSCTTPN